MNISSIFISRSVMTSLIWLGVLIFGILAYSRLPVNDMPNVDYPVIYVSASLSGANPETMAVAVATPLEREFSTIAGIDSMTSTSRRGSTTITLVFDLDRDIDAAAQDVQSAISKVQRRLPSDMSNPPTIRKVNPADRPILYLSLSSDTMPLSTVHEYADTFLVQRMSTISGVAQISIYGSQKYAVRIQLDPNKLASRGIGIDQVAEAVRRGNVILPVGTLHGRDQAYTLQATGQLKTSADYNKLLVAYQDGHPVRLEELGAIIDSVEDDKIANWVNSRRSITLAVQRQPGTNTIEVVDAIKRLLPSLQEYMPAGIEMRITYDRSQSIRESVNDVKFTLVLSVCLVVLVVFLFLRNLPATIITSLAVPLSIVGTFAVMHQLDFSLNNISLMGMTLAVGFVVDDAIVMLENIVRHQEKGAASFRAARVGSKEIGFTVISMTISLVAVFIPLLFMGDLVGRLFREFAVTIACALLVSGVVSLTLTPMLCAKFLQKRDDNKRNAASRKLENIFDSMLALYQRGLKIVLNHTRLVMLLLLATTIATLIFFIFMPKGFFPSEDIGQISGKLEASQGTSFEAMVQYQAMVSRIIEEDPDVLYCMIMLGGSGANVGLNTGNITLRLRDRRERGRHVDDILASLRLRLSNIPGIKVFLQNPPARVMGGRASNAAYDFTLQSPDMNALYYYAPLLEERLKGISLIRDVSSDLQVNTPQVTVNIDRDRASSLGLSAQQIEDSLYYAYGSRQVSTIYSDINQYDVILELSPQYQSTPEALSLLKLQASSGRLVPLESIARLTPTLGPLTVNHSGQLPAVTISFNTQPGVSLSQATDAVRASAREILPDDINANFEGTAKSFQEAQSGLIVLLILAIVVIYLVLGILYESFWHPLTILSGLPTAALGAQVTLLIFGQDLNLYAFVGIIMLVGIMKKNAIMMIDFAIARRRQGMEAREAIYQGCVIRFRPIMMTTFAALFGALPIALGLGAGGEARQPLGLAVVGGLLFSQLLTLFITPVFYIYMEKIAGKFKSFGASESPEDRVE